MTTARQPADGATLSLDRVYRYALWRTWSEQPTVNFIMLNPSTADERENDPTIRRCIAYAHRWGYGGIVVTNLYAFRASDPKDLPKFQSTAIGGENADHLLYEATHAKLVLCAWGSLPISRRLVASLTVDRLRNAGLVLHCLRQNADRMPSHPLYLSANLDPVEFAW